MLLFIIFVVSWILYRLFFNKPSNFPPGPPSLPIIGSVPFLRAKNFQFYMEEVRPKYGPIIGFKLGSKNVVAVSGPEEVKEVLSRDEFQGRPNHAVVNPGIIFNEGSSWTAQRRFTIRHLRDFGFGKKSVENVILEEVDEFFRQVLADNKIIQVSSVFNTSAINVLWAMMAGKRYSHDDKNFKKLLDCLQKRFRSGDITGGLSRLFPFLKKIFPKLKFFQQENETEFLLNNFLQETIDEHKRTKTNFDRDLIDVYLSELEKPNVHSSFNEVTLKNICIDLFSAGSESVGNSLSFCLLYTVLYPEWQDKMNEEIKSYFDGGGKSYLEGKQSMPLVEAFLREVNRSNTIATLTVPHKVVVDTTLKGYFIPKDTLMFISLWSVLQDKNHWGDPENFRPERFLDETGNCIKDDGWVPIFGFGKRICPGESLARSITWIFFVSLIQNYIFSIPEGHPKPSTICLSGFTNAPQPFQVEVKKRS